MRVVIYVEGPSDKVAMEALLAPLIAKKSQQGIRIEFFPIKGSSNDRGGDAKKELLINAPKKAVNILRNEPNAIVIILPDLYPPNRGFEHQTFEELEQGIIKIFDQVLKEKEIEDERIRERLKIFCFKYEMEALILADESALEKQLGVTPLNKIWTIPVEDQNHDFPPCTVLEKIFQDCGKKYKKTVDAPLILGNVSYLEIADKCPQCFKPFVEFLENV